AGPHHHDARQHQQQLAVHSRGGAECHGVRCRCRHHQAQAHGGREPDGERAPQRPGHSSSRSGDTSRNPTPRTVWSNSSSAASWSLRRRLPTWTSTTLLSGSKWRSHTFSSSSVRRITSSGRKRKCSSSWNSLGVSSSFLPLTLTLCFRRSSSTGPRSEEHTSELQSRFDLVCRLLLE